MICAHAQYANMPGGTVPGKVPVLGRGGFSSVCHPARDILSNNWGLHYRDLAMGEPVHGVRIKLDVLSTRS